MDKKILMFEQDERTFSRLCVEIESQIRDFDDAMFIRSEVPRDGILVLTTHPELVHIVVIGICTDPENAKYRRIQLLSAVTALIVPGTEIVVLSQYTEERNKEFYRYGATKVIPHDQLRFVIQSALEHPRPHPTP